MEIFGNATLVSHDAFEHTAEVALRRATNAFALVARTNTFRFLGRTTDDRADLRGSRDEGVCVTRTDALVALRIDQVDERLQ